MDQNLQACACVCVILLLTYFNLKGTFTTVFTLFGHEPQPSKFITYSAYWGFSNQIMEMKVAANWAKYTGRTLVLPRWAHSRDARSLEPETCSSLSHLCEPLFKLIDVSRLREFVSVEIAQEHHTQNNSLFVVDFGVDFRTMENRTRYLVRWMSDDPDMLAQDNYFRKKPATTGGIPEAWCHTGLLASQFRCMRSAHELSRRPESTIHFPRFSTFQVGKLWSSDPARRSELNEAVDAFVRPSRSIFRIARRVMNQLNLMRRAYNAIHVRRGDFLNTSWAKIGNLTERGVAMLNTLMRHPSSSGNNSHRIVFVATDDEQYIENDGRARLIAAGYTRVVTWPRQLRNSVSPLSRSLAEQLICARAHIFDGQQGSTWSSYVELLRQRPELLQDARGREDDL